MLPDEIANLWTDYLRAEQDRVRAIAMERLTQFIDRLLREEAHVWHTWALDMAASVSDDGVGLPVRFPLFERVLLPALAGGAERGTPGCARWLAHLDQVLHQADLSLLPQHLRTAEGLLMEAVRLEPADHLARRRLVERRAAYLRYTLHELPAGVLYGTAGATIPECQELLQLLTEFRGHVAITGEADRYGALIDQCTEHYNGYLDYLRRGRPAGSYERFLQHSRSGA
jgi:hypothetical protein